MNLNFKFSKLIFFVIIFFVFSQLAFAQVKTEKQSSDLEEIGNLQIEEEIKGEFLKAISNSLESFMKDPLIPEEKKHIENYKIFVKQNGDKIFISIVANRTKSEINLVGGESSLGVDVVYIVNKKDYKIIKRYFMK